MSVAGTAIAQQGISWKELAEIAPLPAPASECLEWDSIAGTAACIARATIWSTQKNSDDFIWEACCAAVKSLHNEKFEAHQDRWSAQLSLALQQDPYIKPLPTLHGIEWFVECVAAWWPGHWERQDKSDLERALCGTEAAIHSQYWNWPNSADKKLGSLLWLHRLRAQFPGLPVTLPELQDLRKKRRIRSVASVHSAGLDGRAAEVFAECVEYMATGMMKIPVAGDALEEAKYFRQINVFDLGEIDRLRVFAALLHTAAALHRDKPEGRSQTHPVHGYAMVFGRSSKGSQNSMVGVAPGLWRLQVEGEQYLLTCELWPRPVVMSPHEFGRARGSANAILRDVGIAVDSPPGHWKAVWETHGLRSQLLATAERIDPRVRIEEFKDWIHRIALAAPAANRPPENGAAVRLADGATVASCQWLIGQAMADGIIRPHEEPLFEKTLRQSAKETNRRDANGVQQRLLTIDAVGGPAEIPLIYKGHLPLIENRGDA